jgi:glycerophosphoryl diester phosphodiesterase
MNTVWRIRVFWMFRIIISVLFLLLLWVQFVALPMPDREYFLEQGLGNPVPIDLIAHQGGNLERPDETMEAFAYADALGAQVLEMDVFMTKDQQLAVIHDESIDRTTDGSGLVKDYTMEELRAFDAAYWWPYHSNDDLQKKDIPADQEFPYRGKGLKILELEEIFLRFPQKRFIVELKSAIEEAADVLIEKIDRHDLWEQVAIASFNQEIMQYIRERRPEAITSGTEPEIRIFYVLHRLGLSFLYRPDLELFQVPMVFSNQKVITPGFLRAAHRKNIRVYVWTINDIETMDYLTELGVDGILTDRPMLLKARMEAARQ